MKIDIDKLTEKELVELNHRIVERLRFIQSVRDHAEMMEFNVGEKVSFVPPGREQKAGMLVKYNRKTVTVVTEDGRRWNVSPHLLSKVDSDRETGKKGSNVIEFKGNR